MCVCVCVAGVKFTLPLVTVLAYLYPVLALTRDIVMEKEMRLKVT